MWLGNYIRSSNWLPVAFLGNMDAPSSAPLPSQFPFNPSNHWIAISVSGIMAPVVKKLDMHPTSNC